MKMKGFTLLEMIITLAIMGVGMISVMKYKEKEADEARRQIIADALVSEVSGIVDFLSEEQIVILENGQKKEITNPLYDSASERPYINRVNNKDLNDAMSANASEIIDWSAGTSTRIFFTRKYCISTGTQGTYEFDKDYIPCNEPSVLVNSDLKIERIDFIGTDATVASAIERVDFILSFDKLSADDAFHFSNYVNALEKSAERYSISFKDIYVVERKSAGVTGWSLTTVSGKPLKFSELSKNVGSLDKTKKYGLRLSIDPNLGKFLRADGRVGADKLCWNIDSKMSGPCLASDTTGNNLVLTKGKGVSNNEPGICWDLKTGTSKLCLTQTSGIDDKGNEASLIQLKDDSGKAATMLANVLVEENSVIEPNKKVYRTIPNTTYAAFGNGDENDLIINDPGSYRENVTTEKGRIELNVQECPVAPNGQTLYPRLSASIASVVADTKDNVGNYQADFSNLSANRNSGGRLGYWSGSAIQVNQSGGKWYITATMGVFDPLTNTTSVYLNPKFLSVNITTWCSTEPQT
ncbi:type II secretion system protein [Escherichia coli]|uniref:type II secretion system protein n=1 Tax=Escherichia coli TaxID=562 RepID=UPI000B7E5F44|nr:prepilin-type N-terminal cleavage/methylation domain-containing protein [Escherichia coli]EFN9442038.1 prepilin-type N-terminal cleavage/methylation domain-containing protein [Escherichia coli]EFO3747996.1 prepilin-type N-terminal cleavage/methylation domain-containing protein [Escherichia coli]EIM2734665.1 prepilin-type N-terminal cleavage/methylation domain-containing protein [Escherichia coli]HEI2414271.1 prepilin-type N-terminal cleavage/methylation domain-containing protein [Escherichia